MSGEPGNQNQCSMEFMLSEYERLNNLILDELRQSEQRVTFFITIASAIGGALVIFAQSKAILLNEKIVAVEGVLTILLIYGLITLNRMTSRIVQLLTFKKLQGAIQQYFASLDSRVTAYLELRKSLSSQSSYSSKFGWQANRLLRGTLHDLVIFTDSIICGSLLLTALIGAGVSLGLKVSLTVTVTIVAWALLRTYHYYMRGKLPPMMT